MNRAVFVMEREERVHYAIAEYSALEMQISWVKRHLCDIYRVRNLARVSYRPAAPYIPDYNNIMYRYLIVITK